jgi:hypothetical protein
MLCNIQNGSKATICRRGTNIKGRTGLIRSIRLVLLDDLHDVRHLDAAGPDITWSANA